MVMAALRTSRWFTKLRCAVCGDTNNMGVERTESELLRLGLYVGWPRLEGCADAPHCLETFGVCSVVYMPRAVFLYPDRNESMKGGLDLVGEHDAVEFGDVELIACAAGRHRVREGLALSTADIHQYTIRSRPLVAVGPFFNCESAHC